MVKRLVLSLILLLLAARTTSPTAEDAPQAFPPDIVSEIQAGMDDLSAGGLPPGTIVWIDAPRYRFEGASGFAYLMDDTPMLPEGAFRIGSITKSEQKVDLRTPGKRRGEIGVDQGGHGDDSE